MYAQCINTINDAYRQYYQKNIKKVHLEVQITQDNKVVVFQDNVSGKRLKNLKNIHKSLVTLEEYLKHTPQDMEYMIDILRYDDKDYLYRVVHICEQCKPKNAFTYISYDRKFCKHVMSMRRKYLHKIDCIAHVDPIFKNIIIHKNAIKEIHPQMLGADGTPVYESVFVYGLTADEFTMFNALYPWVKGWVTSEH